MAFAHGVRAAFGEGIGNMGVCRRADVAFWVRNVVFSGNVML